MKKFRVTEVFYSIQGEGQFVGVPSVFLRVFGCNFKCEGFGMEAGQSSKERSQVNPDEYNSFEDLPLVTTGCDSYASWDPRFKRFTTDIETDALVELLLEYTPTGDWVTKNDQAIHLIITGGEPLLGWQTKWPELFRHPKMRNLRYVTFETNCTQVLRKHFRDFLIHEAEFHTTFSCSPKLSVSGESWNDAIKPNVALDYYNVFDSSMYFKFVVANEMDMDEVDRAVNEFRNADVIVPVYCMPVGGCEMEYMENRSKVAEIAMRKGYRYSPRLHIDLFGNQWGT
jgi:organic radical activating enzyme